MTIKKLRVVVLAYLLATNVFAASTVETGFGGSGFIATLNIGPGWTRPGDSQILKLQPEIQKAYIPQPTSSSPRLITTANGTESLVAGEIFLGYHGLINSVVEGQIGLAIGASSQVKLKGSVYEDADPLFNNYSYTYGIRNTRLALKAKVLYDPNFYDLFPYLSASGGLGYNHASGFTIKSKIPEEVLPPIFSNNNETGFSYSFGVGLEAAVDINWRVGLGYEFTDWGKSALGIAMGQTVGDKSLRVGGVRVHELLVSLSFVA